VAGRRQKSKIARSISELLMSWNLQCPQVGQAVLAFARSYSSSGPNSIQGGQAALPAPPAKLSPSKGMAQPIFPVRQELQGDIKCACRAARGSKRLGLSAQDISSRLLIPQPACCDGG
jgi:hypothetical protein